MRFVALGAAVVATMVAAAVPAGADPDPTPPGPAYQIPGPDGPVLPGTQVWPPRCLRQPAPCFDYNPSTGTWAPKGG